MSKIVTFKKSDKKDKKYMAVFDIDGKKKVTHFGAKGYKDYTSGATEEQRKAYRSRHAKDLSTNDATRAGYLSYYILWSGKSLDKNIKDYKKRFGFK